MRPVSNTRLTYTPRPDATPEGELAALTAVYQFILVAHTRKKAAEASGGEDDGKGDQHVPATVSIL